MPTDCTALTDCQALTGALIAAAVFFPMALVAWRIDRRDLAERAAREAQGDGRE